MTMRWIDEVGSLRRLALFRVLVGILILRHALPFLQLGRRRFFGDFFFVPYADWIPQPPGADLFFGAYVALCAAGVLITMGLFTRVALAVALALGSWLFLLNQLFYSNNRLFLLLCLFVLLVSPSHRALSLDAWLARRPPDPVGPLWTQYVLRGQATLLYAASGLSKLVDPDWLGGWVLWTRLRIVLGARSPLVIWLAGVKPLLGAAAIATELFLAAALWFPRTRRLALWIGFAFHLTIEIAFSVHVFSYLMLGTYLLATSAATRNRVLRHRAAHPVDAAVVALLSALDWLGKVRFEPSERLEAVLPDGTRVRGALAIAAVGEAIPLLFPVAYPLGWLAHRENAEAPPEPQPVLAAPSPLALVAAGLAGAAVLAQHVRSGLGVWEKNVWALLVIVVLSLASTGTAREAGAPATASR